MALHKSNENFGKKFNRIEDDRQRPRHADYRSTETDEQRSVLLEAQCDRNNQMDFGFFDRTVHTFNDRVCTVWTELCYSKQVVTVYPSSDTRTYWLNELYLVVCKRCATHITSHKRTHLSKAYWTNIKPVEIPDELKVLTQAEQCLLSRIIPYVKVVKFNGLFGQHGFKGQAILFDRDLFEVSDRLLTMLPRQVNKIDMVMITEYLDNLAHVGKFTISRKRV